MSKPGTLQDPLRKAGYKVMDVLVKDQMERQVAYHGAQLIYGSWNFPGMPARWREPSALFATGEIARDELYDVFDRRQAFDLQIRKMRQGWFYRLLSPARGKPAKLKVYGIGVLKSLEGATLPEVFARDLNREKNQNCAVFKQTQTRIPATTAASTFRRAPPGALKKRLTRIAVANTIESRNAILKNGRTGLSEKEWPSRA